MTKTSAIDRPPRNLIASGIGAGAMWKRPHACTSAARTRVASFIVRHPTTKMLALSLLILIGVALIADGLGLHIPRGYVAHVHLAPILQKARRKKGRGTHAS
jgi:hypothetical protein